jgi:hypothetical protein
MADKKATTNKLSDQALNLNFQKSVGMKMNAVSIQEKIHIDS